MSDDSIDDRRKHVKVVVIGDSAVGKTSMLLSYARGEFPLEHAPTVFDNFAKQCMRAGLAVSLELVDTAGAEEYDRLRPLSYTGCDVVLCCYSATLRDSFAHVAMKWAPEAVHFCPCIPVVLVALKTDLRDEMEDKSAAVSTQEGIALAAELKAEASLEASARTRVGLDAVFDRALDAVLSKRFPARYTTVAGSPQPLPQQQQQQQSSSLQQQPTAQQQGVKKKGKRVCAIL